MSAALLAYNGGGDPNYPNLVLPLMANYQSSTANSQQAQA
jgi:hypothetical protein